MEHFGNTPCGVTETGCSQSGGVMSVASNGWRKPSPGLLQAERYADVGEGLSVPKGMRTSRQRWLKLEKRIELW